MNRRNFFAGAATAVAATTVSRVSMAALPEPVSQASTATAPPLVPPNGRPYNPVVTLNVWTTRPDATSNFVNPPSLPIWICVG